MIKKVQIFSLISVLVFCVCSFADAVRVSGNISNVTVYRGQALVTRSIEASLPGGTSEVVVEGLPGRIIPESLYAQTDGGVQVLSVRYRERAVQADTRDEVRELDEQIKAVRNELKYAERNHKHGGNLWTRYDRMWQLAADATQSDFNRGLLQSDEIEALSSFLEDKFTELHRQALETEDRIAELKDELEVLERKRAKLDAGRSRTEREAVLFVSSEGKRKSFIELNYLVNGANWLPQYNLRANPENSEVLIEYNAVVNQTSGENWDGVSLSLSTAEPAMVAAAPELNPMAVGLSSVRQQQQAGMTGRSRLGGDFKRLAKSRLEQARKGAKAQKELSKIAVSNQLIEFNISSERELADMKEDVSEVVRLEGISVSYRLPGKLSLPSRSDQQLVNVASITADADFTLVATPLLTDYVYLQAGMVNDSDTVFLPGPASMFRNGEFAGKSEVPVVTVGERFTAGFGIDSQVKVVRELDDKNTRIQGGNRIDTYDYRITLNNYKSSGVELRLLDRLPYSENNSIKIELLETNPELSMDSEYQRTSRKKGMLRWDMELPPNSFDEDEVVVSYEFTMEYDRNMQIKPIDE